ncbi:MAG: protoporphyrinogen/coproporphyrinogen oxidase [Polyangiales bacterium]
MKIAVVGAGIAGLTAAFRLQQAGHRVQVFEAATHPGGRMWSERIGGFELDLGVHMLLAHYDRTRALIEELGLSDQWFELQAAAGGVLHDHELASFSPKRAFDVLRFHGIHLRARVRLFVELARSLRFADELDFFDLSVGGDDFDREDCDSFARRRMGDEATDYVVDSFIRTFHFHGARRMSLKYFEALAALLLTRGEFRMFSLRGHMRALPEALAARLAVEYGAPVESVATLASGGVQLQLRASTAPAIYDAAVVATTAEAARELLRTPSVAQRELLAHASSSSTAVCSFAVPIAVAGNFEGIWIPFVESEVISAVSNETCKGSFDATRCVFSVFLHEEAAALWLERSDEEVTRVVGAELIALFPRYAGQLEALFVQRWPQALPIYGVGQVTRVRAFWQQGQGDGGVWLCGDYLNHPWVEGAVRCGEKVAARLA